MSFHWLNSRHSRVSIHGRPELKVVRQVSVVEGINKIVVSAERLIGQLQPQRFQQKLRRRIQS